MVILKQSTISIEEVPVEASVKLQTPRQIYHVVNDTSLMWGAVTLDALPYTMGYSYVDIEAISAPPRRLTTVVRSTWVLTNSRKTGTM